MYDGAKAWEEDLPAEGSSFDEVSEYAEDNGFLLPASFQWRHACRAGTSTKFFWGDKFDPSYVWYAGNSHKSIKGDWDGRYDTDGLPLIRPHSPKEHDSAEKWNAFGLVDMIGNAWEWCDKGIVAGSCFGSRASDIDSQLTAMASGEDHSYRGFRPVVTIPGLGA